MNQIEDMQTFVRIVEAGSITKAAEQTQSAKSALSRRLVELEKRLGVSLLTRTTRTQKLTESGRSYYQQCLRIIDDLAEIESSLQDQNCSLAGGIKIAAPLSFGLSHLSPALRKFNEIHPDIYFDVDFSDRQVDLVSEGFDMAIRIAHLMDSTLIAKRLFSSRGILCASPLYLEEYGIPLSPAELLNGHQKLHYRGSKDELVFVNKDQRNELIKIPNWITANNGDFLYDCAIDGKGLLYSPDFICYKAIRTGQLVPILMDSITNNEILGYALYPQTRHLSQRVRSLVDYLALYFGERPYWSL